eukprot:358280-Chlamydomonas_euryale.AAC.7
MACTTYVLFHTSSALTTTANRQPPTDDGNHDQTMTPASRPPPAPLPAFRLRQGVMVHRRVPRRLSFFAAASGGPATGRPLCAVQPGQPSPNVRSRGQRQRCVCGGPLLGVGT